MAKGKKSFFERLTSAVNVGDYDDEFDETEDEKQVAKNTNEQDEWMEEENSEGQLTVDVYQNQDEIIIKALVAGVRPDNLDVSITRDMVTIKGSREEVKEVSEENYFNRELYWGSFSRTILLPQEIEVEEATANEKHGLLIIRMPKIDKEKQTKLKVKMG